jgi:hypothetical protein
VVLSHQLAPSLPFLERDRAHYQPIQINVGRNLQRKLVDDIREFSRFVFPPAAGQLDLPLLFQARKQIAAGSMVQSPVRPSPVPQFADMLRKLLPVPIAMPGEQLSDLQHILFCDIAGGTAKNDRALGGILSMWDPNHGLHNTRGETKLPEGLLYY